MKLLLRFFPLVFLATLFQYGYSQTDTDFWFVAPEISKNGVQDFDIPIFFRISSGVNAATVSITQPANPGFAPIEISLPPNGFTSVDLSPFLDIVENKPANTILNYGIHIVSSTPISVYYEIASTYCMCNPELYTLKGRNAVGTNFHIPTQNHFNNHSIYNPVPYNAVDLVATENNTVVTIIPSKAIVGHPAGVPFQISLNKGQTYSALATSQEAVDHLFGSVVTSTKPIAITMTDDLLYGITGCADVIGDQIVPLEITGTEYIAVRGNLTNNGNRAFILATQNNTAIYLDGSATPVATINTGQIFNDNIVNPSTYITTDKPVYVFQTSGFGCELGGALLPPVVCTGSTRVTFFRTTNQQLGTILFTANGNQGNFLVNGSPSLITASGFSDVPGTGGQWVAASLTFDISQIPVGSPVVVENTTGKFHLGLMIGDYGGGCSYGYFSNFAALNLGPDISVCSGISQLLDAGPGRTSYAWYYNGVIIPGAVSQTFTATQPGTYRAMVSDNGCTLQDEMILNWYPALSPDLGNNIAQCETGNPVILSPTGGPYSAYLWHPGGETTPSLTVTTSGSYQVTVTDINGCQAGSNTVTVSLNTNPGVSLSPFVPACSNEPPFFLTGGTPTGGVYSGAGVNSSTSSFDPGIPGAGGLITYTFTDPYGCTGSATQTLTVYSAPTVSLTPFPAVCSNEEPFLLTGGTPPGGAYSGNGVVSGSFDPSLASPGANTITYTIPDANGCNTSSSQPLLVYPAPEVVLTVSSPVCINALPVQLLANPPGGIFSGPGVVPVSGLFYASVAGAGTHLIQYALTDSHGCSDTDSKTVEVLSLPDARGTITPQGIFCQGDQPASFTIVNPDPVATSFTWSLLPLNAGIVAGSSQTISVSWAPDFTGTASIGFQPVSGCGTGPWSPFQIITVNPKPIVSFSSCFDLKTTKNARPITLKGGIPIGSGGVYSGTGVLQPEPGVFRFDPSDPLIQPSPGGISCLITFRYTNIHQCFNEETVTIKVFPSNSGIGCPGTVTDIRDGRHYATYLAGSGSSAKCWMAENLNYGDSVYWALSQTDNCKVEKYCAGNLTSQCAISGGFYQWNELMQYQNNEGGQGICPPGWHVPSLQEWNDLANACRGPGLAGDQLKDQGPYYRFHALMSGFFYSGHLWSFSSGASSGIMFWTSTLHSPLSAYARGLNQINPSLSFYSSGIDNGFPVRCVRD